MTPTPIITFEDNKQLRDCMLWWKERLFLHDWCITVWLTDDVHEEGSDVQLAGLNTYQITHMASDIQINTSEHGYRKDTMVRICQEKTLVHELMHLKLSLVDAPYTYEGRYWDALEHQKVEQFARSLILAKYNLPADWFDNTEVREDVDCSTK